MKLTEQQICDLYDKQSLHENLMLYCRGVDRMDRDLILAAYWPDSTDDHGGFVGSGPDWAATATTYKGAIYSNNHHVSNVLIELDGDRARRESMFINVVTFRDPAVSMFLGGRYRDLCERREGEWKILHRVCVWDWSQQSPTRPGFELGDVPQVSNWGAFHPDDPIYNDWSSTAPTKYSRG